MGSQVDYEQVLKAASVILKLHEKKKESASGPTPLWEDEEFVTLEVGLTKIPRKPSVKPRKIVIPHALYEQDDIEVCVFTTDPKDHWKELFEEQQAGVKKVVPISKLKKNYPSFDMKRKLRDSYDLFLADERVIPMLTKPLGKVFLKTPRKIPIPVKLATEANAASEIKKALACTVYRVPTGPSCTIRVGRSDFTPKQLRENVEAVVVYLVKWLSSGIKGIKSLHLHIKGHPALPVFQQVPELEEKKAEQPVEKKDLKRKGGAALAAPAKKAKTQDDEDDESDESGESDESEEDESE